METSKKKETEELSRPMIFLFMGLMLITGSINTIANKLQQSCYSLGFKYETHQKFVTFCMFWGETICLAIYNIQRVIKNKQNKSALPPIIPDINAPLVKEETKEDVEKPKETEEKKDSNEPKIWYFLFPALFDLCGSSIMSMSLTFLAPSIYQMFRGAVIIFTASAAMIFLKTKIHRHHLLGITIVIIGLIVVGLKAILSNTKGVGSNPVLGIILIISAQLFSASMFITEEKLLKQYKAPPLKVVGMEGAWGVCSYIILLFVFYFIKCPESWGDTRKQLCSVDDSGDGVYRFENPIMAIRQIFASGKLLCYVILYISSIACFNFAGLSVTKHVSSTARTIVDTLRTIVIWGFFMMPFVPEGTQETFDWKQLVGFVILVFGSLIYNEILVFPCGGFDQNTKEAIKKRNNQVMQEEEEEIDHDQIVPPIPESYDAPAPSEEVVEKPKEEENPSEEVVEKPKEEENPSEEVPKNENEYPQEQQDN